MNRTRLRESLTARLHVMMNPRRPGEPARRDDVPRTEKGNPIDELDRIRESSFDPELARSSQAYYFAHKAIADRFFMLEAERSKADALKREREPVSDDASTEEKLLHPRSGQSYYVKHRDALKREEQRAQLRAQVDQLEIEMRRLDEEPAE